MTGKRIRIFGEFNSIGKVIDIEIPVIAIYVFANLIFCRRIGFFQRIDLFGIAVGIDKLGDGKISTEEEKHTHIICADLNMKIAIQLKEWMYDFPMNEKSANL